MEAGSICLQNDNGIYRGRGATDDKGPPWRLCSARDMRSSRACRSMCAFSGNWKKKRKPQFCGSHQKSGGDPAPGLRGYFG